MDTTQPTTGDDSVLKEHVRIIRALYFEFGWLINSGILQVRYRYGMPTVVHLDDLTREERGKRPVPNIGDLDDIEP